MMVKSVLLGAVCSNTTEESGEECVEMGHGGPGLPGGEGGSVERLRC